MENRFEGTHDVHETHALNNKSSRPVIFLDIDGVINSYPAPKHHMIKKLGAFTNVTVEGYPIWYHPEVIDFFNAVHSGGAADIIWLTTWRAEARTSLAPAVGLEDFPTITKSIGSFHNWSEDWWKWQGVQDFLQDNDEGRPVIWIDDELSRPRKHDFRARYDEDGTNSLFITPQSCPGLTPELLEKVLVFVLEKNGSVND